MDLPQTRHKPERVKNHNGGFMRVTEDCPYVAKKAPQGLFLSVTVS